MQNWKYYNKIIFTVGFLFLLSPACVYAQDIGSEVKFFVESAFDVSGRSKLDAVLVKISSNLYFYIEKAWWGSQQQSQKDEILKNLDALSAEFQNNIRPNVTSVFGSEWRPGIDNDERITVLFHPMEGGEGGYFRTTDEYDKLQLTNSNQREMLYLTTSLLTSSKLKVVLAHEFVHLVTFNQKNKTFGIEEDIWLNEARADFSSTLLGYDSQFASSNLQSRLNDFIESPSNSITEWKGTKYDYASASLFAHYLVDQYGVSALSSSLKSKYTGIDSINYALHKSGSADDFSQTFSNWTVALVLNDCSGGTKYCYNDSNLTNLRILPGINFLPVSGGASLSVINVTKNWAGNWQKFIGGNGNFKLEFSSSNGLNFSVPYILEDKYNKHIVRFMTFDADKKGSISISNFGTDYKSLIIAPSLQSKFTEFDRAELSYPFNYTVSVGSDIAQEEQALITQLLAQIESLKKQIVDLQAKLAGGSSGGQTYCSAIQSNLYFGLSGSNEVKCLQSFLAGQGADIYPEGLVTGYFGSLTLSAVEKFQQKYASEILTPLGLSSPTGYVGPSTRTKVNQLLAS